MICCDGAKAHTMLMCFTARGTICLAGFWLALTLLKCIFYVGCLDDKPLASEQIMFKIFSLLQVNFVPKIGTFQGTFPPIQYLFNMK